MVCSTILRLFLYVRTNRRHMSPITPLRFQVKCEPRRIDRLQNHATKIIKHELHWQRVSSGDSGKPRRFEYDDLMK